MSNIVDILSAKAQTNLYFCVFNKDGDSDDGKVRDISAENWVVFDENNIGNYDSALTENGDSGQYSGTMPANVPAGRVLIVAYKGNKSAADIPVGPILKNWDGTDLTDIMVTTVEKTNAILKGDQSLDLETGNYTIKNKDTDATLVSKTAKDENGDPVTDVNTTIVTLEEPA